MIVLLWTPGKTVRRSEPRPRLRVGRVAQSLWSSALHMWAEDVAVMLRLWWSDPRRRRRRRKLFGKDYSTERKEPSLFTQRANQNVTSPRSLAPLSTLQPSRFIFARLSCPRPSLLSCSLHTPSINSLDLHSRPFSAATDACCSFCCCFHAGEVVMRWLEVLKGRPVMCYIHFPVDCGHCSCTEK